MWAENEKIWQTNRAERPQYYNGANKMTTRVSCTFVEVQNFQETGFSGISSSFTITWSKTESGASFGSENMLESTRWQSNGIKMTNPSKELAKYKKL